jgi:hypothetical protein
MVAADIRISSSASSSVRSSSRSWRRMGTSVGSIGASRLPAGARNTAQHFTSAAMILGPYTGVRGARGRTTLIFNASRSAALA